MEDVYKALAKYLNVEIGEKFIIKGWGLNPYKIELDGVKNRICEVGKIGMGSIMLGMCKIKKQIK